MNEYHGRIRITDEPELRIGNRPDGTSWKMTTFRAVDGRSRKDEKTGEWKDVRPPLWLGCRVPDSKFGVSPELASRELKKGMVIHVEGEIQPNSYKDKDGIERMSMQLQIRRYYFPAGTLDRHMADSMTGTATVDSGWDQIPMPDDSDCPF